MAHECHICGQVCYCDGEDHDQPSPSDCSHDCQDDEDDSDILGGSIGSLDQ